MSAANNRQLGVVLVVEDDWLIRASIVDDLTTAGCIVLEAGGASSAIASLKSSEHIDVLFTDIDLREELLGWDIADFLSPVSSGSFSHLHLGC